MENSKIALLAIKQGAVYDLEINRYFWVNKLIYWKDELMIVGYAVNYKVSEHGKTWRLTADEKLEQNTTLLKDFDEWLEKTIKLRKSNKIE